MNEIIKINQSGIKKNENRARTVLICIVVFHMFIRSMITVMPSVLMTVIMPDMGLNYSKAGMMAYVSTIVMGVFLFVGSSVISRLGAIRTLIIAMVLFGLDGIISYFSREYSLVLFGKALSGIGLGFSIGACSSLIAAWFDKKHHAIANSISSIVYAVSFTAAYGIIVPIYSVLGSWQDEMLLCSGLSILCCLTLLIWGCGKTDKTVVASGVYQRSANSLLCAMKYKEIWYLTVAMTGFMWVYKCFLTYLPNYLTQVYGLSIAQASSATGIMSLAGIIGSLSIGFLYRIVKSKKFLLCTQTILALASALCIPLSAPGPLLYSCIFFYGFSHMCWSTISSTLLMDLEGVTPAILSGLMAIMLGTGNLLALFAPFLFDTLKNIVGMQITFLLFASSLVFSLLSMLMFNVTRPADVAESREPSPLS